MLRLTLISFCTFVLTACGGGGGGSSSDGAVGSDTASKRDSSIFKASSANLNCTSGGVLLHFGFDLNDNGLLDDSEIDPARDVSVCHAEDGTDGSSTLLEVSNEPAGENCPHGGVKVDSGLDTNVNAELNASEIQHTEYVCSARDGEDGQDGTNGLTSLFNVTPETAGANCSAGGSKVESGLDTNSNGVLDASEISHMQFTCNGLDGSDGTDGLISLLALSNEPAGNYCSNGGVKVETGLDANSNGTLDTSEVSDTQYVCNGEDLTDQLVVLMLTSSEEPGANCPAGGDKISSGIDDNQDGVLQLNEVDAVTYSCTVLSEYETLTDVDTASDSQCLHGGTVTYVGLDTNGNGVLDESERQQENTNCAANSVPTLSIPQTSYLANTNIPFSTSFPVDDSDGDTLSLTNIVKPAWLSLSVLGNNVLASGTPSTSDIGQFSVSFVVTDTDMSAVGSFLLDTQEAPANLGTFTYNNIELGEATFSKIVEFKFAEVAAFDRTVVFSADDATTAAEGDDFTLTYTSQVVSSGKTKTFVELQIINDTVYEDIESITINATVDDILIDQTTFTLNDNNGYEILGALSGPFSPSSLVIVGEKAELSGGNMHYTYDIELQAVTRSASCSGTSCNEFGYAKTGHSYLNNYFYFNGSTNQVERYNFETQTYEAISDLPTECSDAMSSSFQGEKLYILGCQSAYEENTGSLFSFDLVTETWSMVTTTGPNFVNHVVGGSRYAWSNIIETDGTLYLYRYIWDRLVSFDLITEAVTDERLSESLNIFSNETHTYLSKSIRSDQGSWVVPLHYTPAPTTKFVEFDPITKAEVVYEFDIGQNAGSGVVFHNGKWFKFGGSNNLGTSDQVYSFILGDN